MSLGSWINRRLGLGSRFASFWGGYFGIGNAAGQVVTPESALSLSAVYRAVRLTGETVASLPVNCYVEDGSGPVLARGSQVDTLIRVSPNADQTPMEFWEQMVGCMELLGEGAARKHWTIVL